MGDVVRKPSHYQLMGDVEVIHVIAASMTRQQWLGYCLGNTLKYRLRAGRKDKLQQEIDKADFYGELFLEHIHRCSDFGDVANG